jgi:hypothetical protein
VVLRRQFADLVFAGLELVPPGVVVTTQRRPEPGPVQPAAGEISTHARSRTQALGR